ncbi:naringenin-chalcone synthase [Oceaniovalibus guishaninsula JLT2003]|uniref:Naringenin-chalcone synthase n=1 Tax=Oceaniovalibus guishaninsula JLT2003 TaxID=1231392 RepID=K2HA23_9RHOB|nr:chalcone synthase [Oceaniovalibus guishaninsula]EKE44393.1 naringenin-chalcone synthase [Oceaniovalibus guishaninsula JLT2003]
MDRNNPAAGPAVRLRGLGTALPPHALPQDAVLAKARELLAPRFPQFDKLAPSFTNAGVDCRYSVAPMDWFEQPRDWPQRNAMYLDGATRLFIDAARAALDDAGLAAGDVDICVTVSSTGIATPTLEARAAAELGFRPDLRRVPLFGLGCAGGVTGLACARAVAAAHPGTTVLMVAVETCTLSFRLDRLRKADIIATVLFGDGAAAAVLDSGDSGPVLGQGREHMWPDTLDIMGWQMDTDGLGVIFDRSIPAFAEAEFRGAAQDALAQAGLGLDAVDRFVCHPGGAKVVEALETALSLPDGTLDHERAVLRAAGNMSAPTALFVLKRALDAGVSGRLMLTALGPGFTASFLPVDA